MRKSVNDYGRTDSILTTKETTVKRRDFFKAAMLGSAALTVPSLMFGNEGTKKGKILYFDLSTEWEHPPTVNEADGTSFSAKIVKQLGYDVHATKDGSIFDSDLSEYKAFVFYTCGDLHKAPEGKKGITEQGLKNLLAAIRSGTGFVGIHSATDTWKTPGELYENQPFAQRTDYNKMVGAAFISHGNIQEATIRVTDPVDIPSLKALGKQTFRYTDEWYASKNFTPDMRVLLIQETDGMKKTGGNACYDRPAYPMTWIRMEGKGRVAYTAFGHDNERWKVPLFQSILTDLIDFATGQIDLDVTPNMDKVCPQADVLKNR